MGVGLVVGDALESGVGVSVGMGVVVGAVVVEGLGVGVTFGEGCGVAVARGVGVGVGVIMVLERVTLSFPALPSVPFGQAPDFTVIVIDPVAVSFTRTLSVTIMLCPGDSTISAYGSFVPFPSI